MPKISVIMGCYNGAAYLDEAIQSILGQHFGDFEFIIFDDASTDHTPGLLARWADRDSRIRLLRNEKNLGLAASLNRALAVTRGQYIARMDADDISLPERFSRQVALLDKGEVDLCGSWSRSTGSHRSRITRYPVSQKEIQVHLFFQTAFSHPSIMATSALYEKFRYNEQAGIAEDYDLWVRMAVRGARMANIPEVLLLYRVHSEQVSESGRLTQAGYAADVRKLYLEQSGMVLTPEEIFVASRIRFAAPPDSREQVIATEKWLVRLAGIHGKEASTLRIIALEWYLYSLRASVFGLWTWRKYRSSALSQSYNPGSRALADLFFTCLVRLRYRSRLYNLIERFSLS